MARNRNHHTSLPAQAALPLLLTNLLLLMVSRELSWNTSMVAAVDEGVSADRRALLRNENFQDFTNQMTLTFQEYEQLSEKLENPESLVLLGRAKKLAEDASRFLLEGGRIPRCIASTLHPTQTLDRLFQICHSNRHCQELIENKTFSQLSEIATKDTLRSGSCCSARTSSANSSTPRAVPATHSTSASTPSSTQARATTIAEAGEPLRPPKLDLHRCQTGPEQGTRRGGYRTSVRDTCGQ